MIPQNRQQPSNFVTTMPRRLDQRQAEVRERILTVTRELVSTHGLEDIGMAQISKAAGISRATLYRYFANRDHVLAEAALDWGQSFIQPVSEALTSMDQLGAAVTEVLTAIIREAGSNLPMLRAIIQSLTSRDPAGRQFRDAVRALFSQFINLAESSGSIQTQDEAWRSQLDLIGYLLFAKLSLLSVGDMDVESCLSPIARETSLILGGAYTTPLQRG